MTKKDKPKNKLHRSDKSLWDDYTKDIKPLRKDNSQDTPHIIDDENEAEDIYSGNIEHESFQTSPQQKKINNKTQPDQLDRRTEEKLRKGKLPLDGRIDLHGLSKAKAHETLSTYLIQTYHSKKRTILVITGKGNSTKTSEEWLTPSTGILKQAVPEWLNQKPLNEIVLKFTYATPKDGGSGALYVYLKRKR